MSLLNLFLHNASLIEFECPHPRGPSRGDDIIFKLWMAPRTTNSIDLDSRTLLSSVSQLIMLNIRTVLVHLYYDSKICSSQRDRVFRPITHGFVLLLFITQFMSRAISCLLQCLNFPLLLG